jgi:hypothetical protein
VSNKNFRNQVSDSEKIKMAKLGTKYEDSSSGSESETPPPQKKEDVQEPKSEPVQFPPKKKKKLSEKQLESLRKGRAKKLEMNQKSKGSKKKSSGCGSFTCSGVLSIGTLPSIEGNNVCTCS